MLVPKNFDLEAELAKCKTADDLTGKNGLVQKLIGGMLEKLKSLNLCRRIHTIASIHSIPIHHDDKDAKGLASVYITFLLNYAIFFTCFTRSS